MRAIGNATIADAAGTHDGGQPHDPHVLLAGLSTGANRTKAVADLSHRALCVQAAKAQAQARL